MKRHNSNLSMFYTKNIINKFASEIGLTQTPELVPITQIQDFVGSADFSIVNERMKFYLKIDSKLMNETNIKNQKSQLYITIYHELCHLKNLELLSNSIPVAYMINSIDHYVDKDSMMYNFAFMLWGEYYAYSHQFEKHNQTPTEYNLLRCVKTFNEDVVKGNYMLDKTHPLHNKYISVLQKDIYDLLYEIITILAYGNVYSDYDLTSVINNIDTYLHTDIEDYVNDLEHSLLELQEVGCNNITIEHINELGLIIYQIYDILKLKVEFTPELEILFNI